MTANEIDHLILDVRHNNGGNSYKNTELVRALVHFETTRADGQLYVLMGCNTFSAAQNLLTNLDRWTSPVYVGEPSGSRPNIVGEDTEVVLPFSGTRASISSVYHQQSWPKDARIWVAPHVPVGLSSEAYFAGEDPALDAVLELIAR
ncbi:MAG: hypothetical protein GY711_26545 [bacterium]|nr:hypothetical protein [bacterium]